MLLNVMFNDKLSYKYHLEHMNFIIILIFTDYILSGQIATKMYFLCSGRVEIFLDDYPLRKESRPYREVSNGTFGEPSLFLGISLDTARAAAPVQLLGIVVCIVFECCYV